MITRLLMKAFEKQEEQKGWQLYLTKYPQMTEENFIPFEDFYKKEAQQPIENKSSEEILKEVEDILSLFKKEKE